MKRKIFSKLLMVALVIAAVGSFVSCKDYDDDINNLQKQIDNAALKSSVEALQSTLDAKITAAQNAAAAAQTAADKAAATANAAVTKAQLDDAISAAKTAAATAANEYADKVATAAQTAAAKEAYEKAEKYVNDEVAKVTAAIPSEDAIKAIAAAAAAELDEKLATELKTWVNEQIDAIDVQGQVEAAVADAIAKIDTATANVNAIWSAVTSIELVSAWNKYTPGSTFKLNMLHGEQVNSVFGDETYKDADELVKYVAGDSLKFNNRIIVRVNPVNATLAKEDIHLINSKGESLDDLVKVTDVKDFTGLITRGDYATGLKQITFVRSDAAAATDAAFGEATTGDKTVKEGETKRGKALYAISVNNTKDAAADRFVSTTFDIDIYYGWYNPDKDFTFTVQGDDVDAQPIAIRLLRNRWDGNKTVGEDQTKEVPSDKWPAELVWKNQNGMTAPEAPAAAYTLPSWDKLGDKSANVDKGDARYGENFAFTYVEKGGNFTISGLDPAKIDYYYVALDKDHAVESAPSEWEAWNSYSYEGILEMTPSTEDKVITISSAAAEGDIIGFRVFAVNYDGTLADPDGKAFYVQVGDPYESSKNVAKGVYTAKKNNAGFPADAKAIVKDIADKTDLYNAGIIALDFDAKQAFVDLPLATNSGEFNLPSSTSSDHANYDKINTTGGAVEGKYWLCKDADGTLATKWQDIKYIAVAVKNPQQQVDRSIAGRVNAGATTTELKLEGTDPDHHNRVANELTFSIEKKMPSAPQGFSWKDGSGVSGDNVTLYFAPDVNWSTSAVFGTVNLMSLMNGLNDNYRIEFADGNILNDGYYEVLDGAPAATTKTGKKVIVKNTVFGNNNAGFVLNIEGPASLDADGKAIGKANYIGSKKSTTMTVMYDWNKISLTCKDHAYTAKDSYLATVDTKTATFSYPLAETTYAWRPYNYAASWTNTTGTSNYTANAAQSSSYELKFVPAGNTVDMPFFQFANNAVAVPAGGTAASTLKHYVYLDDLTTDVATKAIVTVAATKMTDSWMAPADVTGILNHVWATNSKFADFRGAIKAANYVADVYDESAYVGNIYKTPLEIRFVSALSGVQDYYKTAFLANKLYIMVAGEPINDVVDSKLVIKATDAFGQEKNIFEGSIQLKK